MLWLTFQNHNGGLFCSFWISTHHLLLRVIWLKHDKEVKLNFILDKLVLNISYKENILRKAKENSWTSTSKYAIEKIPVTKDLSQPVTNYEFGSHGGIPFNTLKAFSFKTYGFKFQFKSKGEEFNLNKRTTRFRLSLNSSLFFEMNLSS